MTVPATITVQQHRQYVKQGYEVQHLGDFLHNAKIYTKYRYTGSGCMDCAERVCRLSCFVLCCPVICVCCWAKMAFIERDMCRVPLQGYRECFVYNEEASKRTHQDDYKKAGIDPNKIGSIKAYVERNRERLMGSLSHQFLPFHYPSGISAYVFIPYANLNEAEVIRTWNPKTGGPHDTERIIKMGINHGATYVGREMRGTQFVSIPKTPLLAAVRV